jgi:hypothetical protein
MSWPEALLLAAALVVLGIVANVVSGLVTSALGAPPVRSLIWSTVAVVVVFTGVSAYSAMRSQGWPGWFAGGRDVGPTTSPTPTSQASTAPAVTPTSTPSPVHTTRAHPTVRTTGAGTTSSGADMTSSGVRTTSAGTATSHSVSRPRSPVSVAAVARGTYIDSPSSSSDPNGADRGPVNIRFWAYTSANRVVGDLRYAAGGYSGRYGWAPIAEGAGCSVPYVHYAFGAIPAGTYRVFVHVPDRAGLTSRASFGNWTVDESAHRGSWVRLGTTTTYRGYDGGTNLVVDADQGDDLGSAAGCRVTSSVMAWDAVRIELV